MYLGKLKCFTTFFVKKVKKTNNYMVNAKDGGEDHLCHVQGNF